MSHRGYAADLENASRPLRAEVRRLGSILGQVLTESGGPGLLADVERLRTAAIELRRARGREAEACLERVVGAVGGFDLGRAEAVARAFTVYFQLVNLAEERHRVRILRSRSRSGAPVAESLVATVAELRHAHGETEVDAIIDRLELAPVLTAHPTEARRRAVVDALRRIAAVLDQLDDLRLGAAELAAAERSLLEQVSILWATSQLRRGRPSPLDEVRRVMSVFDESLFTLVPVLYRELERACGRARPFVHWGSWVGGDRDGNPLVTHEVTEATLGIQREHVLLGLEAASRRIGRSLTVAEDLSPPSAAVRRLLDRGAELGEPATEAFTSSPGEPHRAALLVAAERLRATRLGEPGAYRSAADFIAELRAVQSSLLDAGARRAAEGELQHLVWQAETFGFHVASLELRQHSGVHRRALADVAPEAADDPAALDRLAAEGSGAAPPRSDVAQEVLATFRTMARLQAEYGVEACRRFVVSFTQTPADVVAVRALARLAVPASPPLVDAVPLFESRADLAAATEVLDGLMQLPGWRAWLENRGRRLEVMLGYSDATKDAGYLAANIALYRAQSALVAWAARHQVDLVIFHGRGGAMGRGGGPAGRAIRSQAPGSVAGRFKVTEQGEVISARYANRAIALRHLEQVASAVLVASTPEHVAALRAAEARYAEAADVMAIASEAVYRELVGAPGFAEFFARTTPLEEIGRLAIGSRPARRGSATAHDLDQLRAIPWTFAWTQNRCNLPGWFGLGTGLRAVVERHGMPYLREMLAEWPFMASVVDNAEMSLAKADPMIAGLYLARADRPELVDRIREEYRLTRRVVLEATGHDRLLAGHPILRMAVELRNPYVDALSFLQLRFLRELDAADPDSAAAEKLSSLIRVTVSGVAAGLQNTG